MAKVRIHEIAKELGSSSKKILEKAKELGLVAGVCRACSASLGVLEEVQKTDLKILDDMKGHAGLRPFVEEGYAVITF